MPHKVHRLALFVAGAGMFMAVLGLLYHAISYWLIPESSGDPYSPNDVLQMFWLVALLVLSGITVMFSAAIAFVPELRNRRLAIILFFAAGFSPAAYYFIDAIIPRIVG